MFHTFFAYAQKKNVHHLLISIKSRECVSFRLILDEYLIDVGFYLRSKYCANQNIYPVQLFTRSISLWIELLLWIIVPIFPKNSAQLHYHCICNISNVLHHSELVLSITNFWAVLNNVSTHCY